jgi:hypothetical protein
MSSQSSVLPPSRPQTPPPRRSAPPRTPDSSGLTPSSRRSMSRRRTQSPPSSPTPMPQNPPIPPVITANQRPRRTTRTIRPRRFYGDTPTPPSQEKLCARHRHMKPLTDYVDINTGQEHEVCKDCRADVEFLRQRASEIEAEMLRGEEELQRLMGNLGIKVICNI